MVRAKGNSNSEPKNIMIPIQKRSSLGITLFFLLQITLHQYSIMANHVRCNFEGTVNISMITNRWRDMQFYLP